jgi:peptidoglycan L-alanyl-D-glutamate endopeptidase CwlK
MPVLQEGAKGPEVMELQSRLKQLGFPPGTIDGTFGPATEAAVLAFQNSQGLLADGIVGEKTATALGFAPEKVPAAPGMPDIPISVVSKMLPDAHLANINKNLKPVLDALAQRGLTTLPVVLAALATIRAETDGFVPISEGISKFNTSPGGHPFDLYDNRADLGNKGPPDGDNFKGRGFVQLTGRANYEKFGPIIGVPTLADQPDQANESGIAANLLAAFVKAKEIPMKQALAAGDLATARRLVNGGSHGLGPFTEAYNTGMQFLGT